MATQAGRPIAEMAAMIGPTGTLPEATWWAFLAIAPSMLAAWYGLTYKPGKRLIAMFLAFSAGLLISTLSFDLVEEAAEASGVTIAMTGFLIGVASYLGVNALVEHLGIIRRTSTECGGLGKLTPQQREQRNVSLALVVGALLDGIPESIGIGMSFLENSLVPAAFVAAAAIANIPEGLASGAGLKKSKMKTSTIMSIWAVVVIACVSSAAIAMATMHNAGHELKSGIMAFAGGGVLAMTLEAVVPEAYSETHHWVSILGATGFTIAFYLSHSVL
jgi:ZIP family zinc transporter